MNHKNTVSYSQQNKQHEQTQIYFLKMQSVGYIRDLNALQLHKKAEKTEKDWRKLRNQTNDKLKKNKYLIHSIDKLILTHRTLFG